MKKLVLGLVFGSALLLTPGSALSAEFGQSVVDLQSSTFEAYRAYYESYQEYRQIQDELVGLKSDHRRRLNEVFAARDQMDPQMLSAELEKVDHDYDLLYAEIKEKRDAAQAKVKDLREAVGTEAEFARGEKLFREFLRNRISKN